MSYKKQDVQSPNISEKTSDNYVERIYHIEKTDDSVTFDDDVGIRDCNYICRTTEFVKSDGIFNGKSTSSIFSIPINFANYIFYSNVVKNGDCVYALIDDSTNSGKSLSLYVESSATGGYTISFYNVNNVLIESNTYTDKEITITIPKFTDIGTVYMFITPAEVEGNTLETLKLGFVGFKKYIDDIGTNGQNNKQPYIAAVFGYMSDVQPGARPINTETIDGTEYRYTYSLIPTGCEKWWEYIDGNPTYLDYMFMTNNTGISKIDISYWPMENWKVVSLDHMFADCWTENGSDGFGPTEIVLTGDTSRWQVETCEGMFNRNAFIEDIDMSSWDASRWDVNSVCRMFYTDYYEYSLLKTVHFPKNWNQAIKYCSNYDDMFYGCIKLDIPINWTNLRPCGFSFKNTFGRCESLKDITFKFEIEQPRSKVDDSAESTYNIMWPFGRTYSLEKIDFSWKYMDICFGLDSSKLFLSSIEHMIYDLPDVTSKAESEYEYYITMSSSIVENKLSKELKEEAKNKGWTITYEC